MALTVRIQKELGDFLLDVDFAAGAGETLALLGASGCGKSMTLKCIAGIERPDKGRIVLDGEVLFDSAADVNLPPQRRRIGYLFQNYALFPHMTAAQNIAAGARHLIKSQRKDRTARLVSLFGLEGTEHLYPVQLSGGQQQRVALARILASEPRALLLDEPFSALDSYLKWRLEMEIQDILSLFSGPVLWVSHDQGEVFRNCASVCVLDEGRSSPPAGVRELMANPGTVSAARISGCKNYVPVRLVALPGMVEVPAWGLTLEAAAPWRKGVSVLGIRAGHVHPAGRGERNAFLCETVHVSEDISYMFVTLRPMDAAADAPPLLMELGREAWAALPDKARFWVAVEPENLLLLE